MLPGAGTVRACKYLGARTPPRSSAVQRLARGCALLLAILWCAGYPCNGGYAQVPVTPVTAPVYLPLVAEECSPPTCPQRVQPGDFEYLGAFRLPGGEQRPATFAYGGKAPVRPS